MVFGLAGLEPDQPGLGPTKAVHLGRQASEWLHFLSPPLAGPAGLVIHHVASFVEVCVGNSLQA